MADGLSFPEAWEHPVLEPPPCARAALCSGAAGMTCVLIDMLQPSQQALLHPTRVSCLGISLQRSSEVSECLV